jgi:hypothetical protein
MKNFDGYRIINKNGIFMAQILKEDGDFSNNDDWKGLTRIINKKIIVKKDSVGTTYNNINCAKETIQRHKNQLNNKNNK